MTLQAPCMAELKWGLVGCALTQGYHLRRNCSDFRKTSLYACLAHMVKDPFSTSLAWYNTSEGALSEY